MLKGSQSQKNVVLRCLTANKSLDNCLMPPARDQPLKATLMKLPQEMDFLKEKLQCFFLPQTKNL